ncbi:hypothetical protein U9002_24000, partial [Escherichia coli]
RLRFSGPKTSIICSPMTSLKTSIKTITYLSDIGCLEIQGASLARLLTEDAVKEYWRWVDKTAELLITLDNFNKLGNGMSMNQFKESVKNIIADDALDAALKNVRDKQSQMNKVKSNPTYSDTFRR